MTKVLISELDDQALDWAVASCEGEITEFGSDGITYGFKLDGQLKVLANGWAPSMSWSPSTNWAQGGPLKEREEIATRKLKNGTWLAMKSSDLGDDHAPPWKEYTTKDLPKTASTTRRQCFHGETELQAVTRCYVGYQLKNDWIEVPDELLSEKSTAKERQRG
jgi:hypothetical protein